jgi:hypothetical protein
VNSEIFDGFCGKFYDKITAIKKMTFRVKFFRGAVFLFETLKNQCTFTSLKSQIKILEMLKGILHPKKVRFSHRHKFRVQQL